MKHSFHPCFKFIEHASLFQIGQAINPFILQPNKFPYARKSLIVHKIATCNLDFFLVTISKVSMPFSHSSFNSSINGPRYTSMSFLGAFGPRISNDMKRKGSFIHFQGCKLYGISIIGHILEELFMPPKGMNPSLAKPSWTLRGSFTNHG